MAMWERMKISRPVQKRRTISLLDARGKRRGGQQKGRAQDPAFKLIEIVPILAPNLGAKA
jgi:hypothetical protein